MMNVFWYSNYKKVEVTQMRCNLLEKVLAIRTAENAAVKKKESRVNSEKRYLKEMTITCGGCQKRDGRRETKCPSYED